MVWGGSPAWYEEMESGATTLKRLACMEGGSMDLRGSQPQGVGTERAPCDTELEAGSLRKLLGWVAGWKQVATGVQDRH